MAPPADLASWTAGLITRSGEETERAAEAFAALLPPDTVLTLGVTGDITSPSFALLNIHEGRRQVFHVDAYRLKSGAGLDDLMIWDVAKSPWNVLVEWPERVATHLPRGLWKLKTSILADGGHRYELTLPG
jgi:tRNA threonylcarbamoyladenosine biosynthesis protein TsaE